MLPTTLVVTLPDMADMVDMAYEADHAIAGKAIVPAVELLNLLQHVVDMRGLPLREPLTLREVSFPRFLPADELARCTFEVALADGPGGGMLARFASRIALPGGMQRQRTHAQASFSVPLGAGGLAISAAPEPAPCAGTYQISAERVYRELVRFGPHFRNLRGTVTLAQDGAWATVASPTPPHPHPSRAGCPYLFDSAMHLACVWGQRYAGLVAYPTGFASRTLYAPIAHGQRHCAAVARSIEPRRLTFDLWLFDEDHRLCDAIVGLVMVPLAADPPPPAWIVA